MGIEKLPDRETFLVARTHPMQSPQWERLKTIVERIRAANGPPTRDYHWGWHPDRDAVSFWLLPAASLSFWTPTQPYQINATHGSRLKRSKLDAARLEAAFELIREIPTTVAFCDLQVVGYFDKPRRSEPHVDVRLRRYKGESTFSILALFDYSHPGLQARDGTDDVIARVRERLGKVDDARPNGENAWPMIPTRSGLTDPDEAFQLFLSVVQAAIPHPTAWSVNLGFDYFQWENWIGTLNRFDLSWCYDGDLLFPHGFDLYKRPSLIHPDHPLRIPISSWKPREPPRLQMTMVHAAEETWLEFETAKGRAKIDEVSALIGPLEIWKGPPQLRWTS